VSALLALGLDAFDLLRFRKLLAEGKLPHLACLLERAALHELEMEWPGVPSDPWRSFVLDHPYEVHGCLYNKRWNPERLSWEFASLYAGGRRPFWERARARGLRVAVVDVPHAPDPSEDPAEVAIAGWQRHDAGPVGVWPPQLAAELGPPPGLGPEPYGHLTPNDLLEVKERCLAACEQAGALVARLVRRRMADVYLVAFGAAHRAGHYLWDPLLWERVGLWPKGAGAPFVSALDEVYQALDRAVGRILDEAPADARTLVFALHGMGAEVPWNDLFDRLLALVTGGRPGDGGSGSGRLTRLRRSRAAFWLARRLPRRVQEHFAALLGRWSRDWQRTRCFALPSEGYGAVRVNLMGRERYGCVRPGPAYEELLAELAEGFLGLRELESGEPVVAAVHRVDRLARDGPGRRSLPDLVVTWREGVGLGSRGVRTADGRTLAFDRPLVPHSRRSGAHRPHGFLLAEDRILAAGSGLRQLRSTRDLPRLIRALAGMEDRIPD